MTVRSPAERDAAAYAGPEQFEQDIVARAAPVVLRGLVAGWPVVHAASRSAADLGGYLARFAGARPVEAFVGDAAIAGKYYYDEALTGFNFARRQMPFADAVAAIVAGMEAAEGDTIYVGSVPVGEHLPGFSGENPMPLVRGGVGGRIWLGHASNVSCHYDTLDNIACVIAGRRRFTLYPPETIADLYVGPIDNTMAGQPVSLAASSAANDDRFPRFAKARDAELSVELEPGDALYLPKLWWHQVESTAPLNGLVNYWWDATSIGPDAPYATLLLAMIAIAERPAEERRAWRAFFDHYVFREAGHPLAHLPEDRHGLLGPLRPTNYGRLRALVMHMLRHR